MNHSAPATLRVLVIKVTSCWVLASLSAFGAVGSDGEADFASASIGDAKELLRARQLDAAETAARELLPVLEEKHGSDSLEVAQLLDILTEALWRAGESRNPETLELVRRAVAIKEAELGRLHPDTAKSLRNEAIVLEDTGQVDEARELFKTIIEVREQAPEAPDRALANALIDLGNLELSAADLDRAEELYKEALEVQETALGPDHLDVALTLTNLGHLSSRRYDFESTERLYLRALEIKEMHLGSDHADLTWTLNGLAILYEELGKYAEAIRLNERVLAIRRATIGPDHPRVAGSLNNLAIVYRSTGDYGKSIELTEQSLQIALRRDDGRLAALALGNLAETWALAGNLDLAVSYARRAAEISRRLSGPEHPDYAWRLSGLADLLAQKGELDRAEGLFQEALSIEEARYGRDHPIVARTLNSYGAALTSSGRFGEARARLQESLLIRRRFHGEQHPLVAETLLSLGMAESGAGDRDAALEAALLAESIGRDHLRLTAQTFVENQALRYAIARPNGLNLALTLAVEGLDPGQLRRVWDALIRSRALVLDEMATRAAVVSRSENPEIRDLARELALTSRRLAHLATRGPDPDQPDHFREDFDRARAARDLAELRLAERSVDFRQDRDRLRVGWQVVVGSFDRSQGLLSLVRYRNLDKGEDRYAALSSRDGGSSTGIVDLGSAETLEALVLQWTQAIRAVVPHSPSQMIQGESAYREVGRQLRIRIWDPVVEELEGVDQLFVVPDGSLHLLSWVALPLGTASYLIDSGPQIHYLSAERDLFFSREIGSRGQGLLAMGGARFDSDPSAESALFQPTSRTDMDCTDLGSMRFMPLPATDREVKRIVSLWNLRAEDQEEGGPEPAPGLAVALTGEAATEDAFKAEAPGHEVLHLATHGFFLSRGCDPRASTTRGIGGLGAADPPPGSRTLVENPLLLSGLTLAGANDRHQRGPDEEDGILTSQEVAALDLAEVGWAVLSACDTGVGEIHSGEGVLGLRRAFQIAGVRTVVMSLWPVEDEATERWMTALYEARLTRRFNTAQAVHAASLETLQERRKEGKPTHPFYWAGFVAAGDWR